MLDSTKPKGDNINVFSKGMEKLKELLKRIKTVVLGSK